MRVYVINCRQHAERRASAQSKLQQAGVRFEFFDGLCADEARGRQLFEAIDETEFLINTGRRITDGEIGCFASHREVWKRAAHLEEPVVIMEDDFDLLGDFSQTLGVVSTLLDRAGFIRLQTDLRAKKCRGIGLGRYRLCCFTKPPHGLMCYALSPQVARRFLAATRVLREPVDIFTKKYWEHGQPMFVLTPQVVGPSGHHRSTTIEGRAKTPKPLPIAARRFLRKAASYPKRWRFNRLHREGVRHVVRGPAREPEPGRHVMQQEGSVRTSVGLE